MKSLDDRVFDHLEATASAHGEPKRSDLRMVDHLRVGANQAQVLIQYDILRGAPTISEVDDWFSHRLARKAHLVRGSIVSYRNEPSVTCVASLTRGTRPLSDSSKMHNFTLGAYKDMDSGTVWEVQMGDDGVQYLVARVTEDLDEVFRRQTQRPIDKRVASTLKDLFRTAARVYNVGDTVSFVDGDNVLRGEVTSCSGNTCTVKASGGSRSIDCGQIVDVVRVAVQNINDQRNELDDYYAKAYGDKGYAEELTHTMSKDMGNHNPAITTGPKKV